MWTPKPHEYVTKEQKEEATRINRRAAINEERDRRIEDGMTWRGDRYQTRREDRENLGGKVSDAIAATLISDDNYSAWWITEDNRTVPLSASDVIDFGRAMAAHKEAHIFAAHALKESAVEDIRSDDNWPPKG